MRRLLSKFDLTDVPVSLVMLGIALIGYGAAQLHDGLGHIAIGALLVLYVKPLGRWLK